MAIEVYLEADLDLISLTRITFQLSGGSTQVPMHTLSQWVLLVHNMPFDEPDSFGSPSLHK